MGGQQVPGHLILHAFGDDCKPKVVTQVNSRTHDRRIVVFGRHAYDKGFVDFDVVHW